MSAPLHASFSAGGNIWRGRRIRTWHSCASALLLSSSPRRSCPQASAGSGPEREQVLVRDLSRGPTMWLIALAALLHCASAHDVDLKGVDGLAKARVEVQYTEASSCMEAGWDIVTVTQGQGLSFWIKMCLSLWMDAPFSALNCPCWAHARVSLLDVRWPEWLSTCRLCRPVDCVDCHSHFNHIISCDLAGCFGRWEWGSGGWSLAQKFQKLHPSFFVRNHAALPPGCHPITNLPASLKKRRYLVLLLC